LFDGGSPFFYNLNIDTLEKYQKEIRCKIYAYCLMGNHVYLLLKEGNEEIGNTIPVFARA
jgi:REP element-mobilizing transposase RayT